MAQISSPNTSGHVVHVRPRRYRAYFYYESHFKPIFLEQSPDSMDPPCDSGSQEICREENVDALVVACGDSPEILEPTEHRFDEVAVIVGLGIVGPVGSTG